MKILFGFVLFITCTISNAALIQWSLEDFSFDDGGTAIGSFIFDTSTNTYSNIDIVTTLGSSYSGSHYMATAGAWGVTLPGTINAFSSVETTDFTNQPWLRIDASIDFNAQSGDVVNQRLEVGAESYCVNALCSTSANPHYRNLVSGYLVANPVPIPSALLLFASGFISMFWVSVKSKRET